MENLGGLFFLAGVIIIIVAISSVVYKVKRKIRDFSQMAFGTDSLMDGFKQSELEAQQTPKSLAGMDAVMLPLIKKDFPDFNVDVAKNHIRKELKAFLNAKDSVKIHNVVIRDYKKHKYESVITMQASAEYIENSVKQQKRYDFKYVYALALSKYADNSKISAVCPHCGGAVSDMTLGYCEYCGAQMVDIIERNWTVKDIVES